MRWRTVWFWTLALLCAPPALATAGAADGAAYPFVTRVEQLDDPRFAQWIQPPAAQLASTGLYLFRREFRLDQVPSTFTVHVSADPRYKLFVNGTLVTFGPAAGDPLAWFFASVDLAPYLAVGRNVVAIEVWDAGPFAPARQVALRTAMILQGPAVDGAPFLSDRSWRVWRSAGWSALPMSSEVVGGGYIAGATEQMEVARHPEGWTRPGFDDRAWPQAEVIGPGSNGALDTWLGTPWPLTPRPIPLLTLSTVPAGRIREVELPQQGDASDATWPLVVPPHAQARILVGRDAIVVGFPRLTYTGGAGAEVRMRYQESLFHPDGTKGQRGEIAGKTMKGYFDLLRPDGGTGRVYQPAWVRTYRYLELSVSTAEQPLTLDALDLQLTRYPFERRGAFNASDPSLTAILDACWRTAEVCALETYMDCPYYEQVQYIGDTRIQALISLYVTGDDRLMRNAIQQFHRSLLPNGLTRSSYPTGSRMPQIIPPFSLIYISMVHDYFLHRDDPDFIRDLLPGIRFTLDWFLARVDDRGLLGPLPYWNHTDGGARGFRHGSPPGASTGGSVQLTLLLAIALADAQELFAAAGRADEARRFGSSASRLVQAVNQLGYVPARGLYAETPEHRMFTQHTNALAVLADAVPAADRAALAERLVSDRSLVQGTLYFQFYVFTALREAGRGDLILPELERWRAMLATGLTTFPEHGPESRSDAHAWSAHPLYHLLATTAGVTPESPGFRTVRIRPAPGNLSQLSATVCHPDGEVTVEWARDATGRWRGTIGLPPGVSGVFEWEGRSWPLPPGVSRIEEPLAD